MKMYILLKDSVPDRFAPLIAAHASLACYKQYEHDSDMQAWISSVFRKVVCRVSDQEFEQAKLEPKCTILTESALENREVCIAYCPRGEYAKRFRFLRMWVPIPTVDGTATND